MPRGLRRAREPTMDDIIRRASQRTPSRQPSPVPSQPRRLSRVRRHDRIPHPPPLTFSGPRHSCRAGANEEEVAVAFTSLLDNHVETVNSFYMERIEEGVIILHALHQHGEQILAGAAKPELRPACQRSLVSFHFQLLVLQNYVALNFTALTKILKKFEKKFELCIKDEYINAIVELPFYRCDSLGDLVEETERQFKLLESLSPAHVPQQLQPGIPGTSQHAASSSAAQQLMPPPPPMPQRAGPGAAGGGMTGGSGWQPPAQQQHQLESASRGKAPMPAHPSGMALS